MVNLPKNGFILLETIVTIFIILSGVLSIYSIYINHLNKITLNLYYDEPSKIYEAYYLKQLLNKDMIKTNEDITIVNETFLSSPSDIAFFAYLKDFFQIKDIYIIKGDIDCQNNNSSFCKDKYITNYLKQTKLINSGYYLVVREQKDCENKYCYDYLTSIRMDDEYE